MTARLPRTTKSQSSWPPRQGGTVASDMDRDWPGPWFGTRSRSVGPLGVGEVAATDTVEAGIGGHEERRGGALLGCLDDPADDARKRPRNINQLGVDRPRVHGVDGHSRSGDAAC